MTPSPRTARLMLVTAATLWSTSGLFMRMLQKTTALHLETPALSPLQIGFYRSVFAGLIVLLLVRRSHLSMNGRMLAMLVAFGTMTAFFITALGQGSAANAILLQNTAPVWVYFIGVSFLGDARDRRTLIAVLIGLAGALVIVFGNWPWDIPFAQQTGQGRILIMATGSGFFYAMVVLLLRSLNRESAAWLSVLNLLGGAVVIAAFGTAQVGVDHLREWLTQPSLHQFLFIAVYGIIQLAIPYVLFTIGLKSISPQEAGIITLIEPLLNPFWAYLISPETDTPTLWTLIGGGLLLFALVWRYR